MKLKKLEVSPVAGKKLRAVFYDDLTFARPDLRIKGGLAHQPRSQSHRRLEQVRLCKRSEREAHAVTACACTKGCTQVSPSLTQCVFI
jgi:hypothetical protein